MSRRPYEELQRLVEQERGLVASKTAAHPRGGAFVVALRGKQKGFRSRGPAGCPPPTRWTDRNNET